MFGYKLEVPSCTNCDRPDHTDDDVAVQTRSTGTLCEKPDHSRASSPKVQCRNLEYTRRPFRPIPFRFVLPVRVPCQAPVGTTKDKTVSDTMALRQSYEHPRRSAGSTVTTTSPTHFRNGALTGHLSASSTATQRRIRLLLQPGYCQKILHIHHLSLWTHILGQDYLYLLRLMWER